MKYAFCGPMNWDGTGFNFELPWTAYAATGAFVLILIFALVLAWRMRRSEERRAGESGEPPQAF